MSLRSRSWIAIGVVGLGLLIAGLLLFRGSRSSKALEPVTIDSPPLVPAEVEPVPEEATANGGVEHRVEAEPASTPTVPADAEVATAPAEPTQPRFELWLAVFDEQRVPIADARVSVRSAEWTEARSVEPREEDGFFFFGDVPAGPALVVVRAPGYATDRFETFVPLKPNRVEVVELRSAARVRGRIAVEEPTARDAPLEVLYWTEGSSDGLVVTASDDGRFALEDVKAGIVHLLPRARGVGAGEETSLALAPGDEREVVLRIPAALVTLEGRLVSTATGGPLAGARVLLALPAGVSEHAVETPQPSALTDADGRFALRACAPGGRRIALSARDHTTRFLDVPEHEHDASVDLGTIELGPVRPLAVQLRSTRPLVGLDYRLRCDDGRFPAMAFGDDGRAVIADYPYEEAALIVDRPDGNPILVYASLGDERRIEIALDGERAALVRFDLEPAPDPAEGLVLVVSCVEAPGVQLSRATFLADLSPVRVEGLPDAALTAVLRVVGGRELGDARGRFEPGRSETELVVRGTGLRKTFEVVAGDGTPLAGVKLYVMRPGDDTQGVVGFTDGSGACTLLLPEGTLSGMLHHPAAHRTCIPIEPGAEPQRITVEPTGSLEVEVELGGLPLDRALCTLGDPVADRLLTEPEETDGEGRLRWEHLHAGRYMVNVNHPAITTVHQEVAVSGEEPSRLTVRAEPR